MVIHYLQHVRFENLGSIKPILLQNAHLITSTQLYQAHPLPSPDEFDWLIVLGGPMGVHDTGKYPWLVDEKRLIERAIDNGKLVLGICLGAQLIADVLGARVYAGPHKEIGWFPVERVDVAASTLIGSVFPEMIEAFHWHGDTFDLPHGALHLARSQAYENQAFVFEDRVLALQFHLETTLYGARLLINNCGHELVDAPFIQEPGFMLEDSSRFERINKVMETILIQFNLGRA